MSQVIAIERGYDNIVVREAGDVFEWPDKRPDGKKNPIPEWAEPVNALKAPEDHDLA